MASICPTASRLEMAFDVIDMLVGVLQNRVPGESFCDSLALWFGEPGPLHDRCLQALDQAVIQVTMSEDISDFASWERDECPHPDIVQEVVLQAVRNECSPTLRG